MNKVVSFFHKQSSTYSYIVIDQSTNACVVIDPVLDYDASAGRTSTESASEMVDYIKAHSFRLEWILETHVHADHLSSAAYLKAQLGGKIAIGAKITDVQQLFKGVFNTENEMPIDGSQFDALLENKAEINFGESRLKVMHTPGHTPACSTYVINDELAFVGDTIFMPDMGTARCDFPGGSAQQLFSSIQQILSLPDETILYMCHDYAPNGREYKNITTVREQRHKNIHVNHDVIEKEFVSLRTERDNTLAVPALLIPSVQFNMRTGQAPKAESNGKHYLKIPLNQF
ncbi:MBL fold metallo-hydrolase [Vibrio maerlii]|uniref:MBL fold metallo-hydrolase n=1 Tax=Vibrio maerlii TaxID=2231648 RepID=UPI001F12F7B3|nr:MBL fold metallo-hydrolase [Vibrio maerlii]